MNLTGSGSGSGGRQAPDEWTRMKQVEQAKLDLAIKILSPAHQIKQARKGLGWTQTELGKAIGTSHTRVYLLESGANTTFSTLSLVARKMGFIAVVEFVEPGEIVGRSQEFVKRNRKWAEDLMNERREARLAREVK